MTCPSCHSAVADLHQLQAILPEPCAFLCLYCGDIAMLVERKSLRPPTDVETAEIRGAEMWPVIRQQQQVVRQRAEFRKAVLRHRNN